MESFFRYISYVDYYKKSERIKNVGFLRWKLHNDEHCVEIQLKNVFGFRGEYEIKEINTEKVIGKIKIDQGIGNYTKKFPSMIASGEMYIDTFDDRLYLCDVEGFLIYLKEEEYLSVHINLGQEKKSDRLSEMRREDKEDYFPIIRQKEKNKISDDKREEEENHNVNLENSEERSFKKSYKEEITIISDKDNCKYIQEDGDIRDKDRKSYYQKEGKISEEIEAASENILIEGIEEKYIDSEHQKQLEKYAQPMIRKKTEKYIDSASNKKIKIIEPIYEDKWRQLCVKFQQVHPFPNKRIFLSIQPEDFIVLQQEYQKLVHNSFLLHGFYNYGHMILGKLTDEEEAPVYIGVPGVYYEREKQAARMFGFAGFESTEHPVQAGSYGYYMIEVEI